LAWVAIRTGLGRATGKHGLEIVLLTVGAVLLLLYPFMPFSGTINAPDADLRFLIAHYLLGLLLLFLPLDPGRGVSRFWGPVTALIVAMSWGARGFTSAFVSRFDKNQWPPQYEALIKGGTIPVDLRRRAFRRAGSSPWWRSVKPDGTREREGKASSGVFASTIDLSR
jgi:hypothetical protein